MPPRPHPPRERPRGCRAPSGGKGGGNAWWEAQKAALMGESVPPEVKAALAATPLVGNDQTATGAGADGDGNRNNISGSGDLADLNIPNLPEPIDFENITLDDARAAIRERDVVLQQLRESLILLKASGQLPSDLLSLNNVPEPLRIRIAELEAQWQAKFRQVELEVSLERARLTREQAAVRQQQEALQKQFRKEGAPSKTFTDDGKGDEKAAIAPPLVQVYGQRPTDYGSPCPIWCWADRRLGNSPALSRRAGRRIDRTRSRAH